MPDVSTVRVSPTCGVPLIVGVPVASVFDSRASSGGPITRCAAPMDRARPSDVQTARSASHAAVGASVMDSASRVSGLTVIAHTPLSSSTRAGAVTGAARHRQDVRTHGLGRDRDRLAEHDAGGLLMNCGLS